MRFASFSRNGQTTHLGAVLPGERILDLTTASPNEPAFRSMLALIDGGPAALEEARRLAARGLDGPKAALWPLDEIRLAAPIPRPRRNVFCVGLNYRSHIEQNARALGIHAEIGDVPLFFTKPTTAVIGPGDPIRHDDRLTSKLDYEVELGVIIGTGGTWIQEADALNHVFGFTLVNEVSARDLQWRTSQMFIGKGLDSFCPTGPWIVDVAEAGDGSGFELVCRINGEERQRDTTSDMVFSVRQIIAELSKGLTLEPGDIISTGTPGGCGYQLTPPRFLVPGDVAECSADGLGRLANPVIAWPPAPIPGASGTTSRAPEGL